MPPSETAFAMSRYGSDRDKRVPDSIALQVRISGHPVSLTYWDGKFIFRMTDSHFQAIDTAGAGIVMGMERGLVRQVEIYAK